MNILHGTRRRSILFKMLAMHLNNFHQEAVIGTRWQRNIHEASEQNKIRPSWAVYHKDAITLFVSSSQEGKGSDNALKQIEQQSAFFFIWYDELHAE